MSTAQLSTAQWAATIALIALPPLTFLWLTWRSAYMRLLMGSWLGAMGAGAALKLLVATFEGVVQRWAEIDPVTGSGGQLTLLLYAFLVVAPLEMALVVGAVAPLWRLRRLRMRAGLSRYREIQEGVAFAAAAAIGFASVGNVLYALSYGTGWLSVTRIALATPTFLGLCTLWGYVLGRNADRGMAGRRFRSAWLGATLFYGVADQLVFRHGLVALLAVLPMLLAIALAAFVLWRDLGRDKRQSSGRLSILYSAPAPSLAAIRDAFREHDRPITLRWISFGALVTTGMITAGIVAAVAIGRWAGLDFSAVDQPGATTEVIAPLVVLGAGVLAAFPSSGYLLARASGTRSVLEPAMAASLAMVLVMVFMGMLAPVSVVFAIAFAPIAFALSCIGRPKTDA
jgi:hypothetical protein